MQKSFPKRSGKIGINTFQRCHLGDAFISFFVFNLINESTIVKYIDHHF